MKDKIIQMLSNGIPQSVVAKACGVTDGYVSQLMSDEDIRAQVTEAKIQDVEKGMKTDSLVEDLESEALEKLKRVLPFVSKPLELVRIFQAMNTAKKKTEELTHNNTNPTAPLVQISISGQAAIAFKMDSSHQVVEVDGRSMTTLPAKQLTEQLVKRREARPLISDATTASELLDRIELGIPADSLAHVL